MVQHSARILQIFFFIYETKIHFQSFFLPLTVCLILKLSKKLGISWPESLTFKEFLNFTFSSDLFRWKFVKLCQDRNSCLLIIFCGKLKGQGRITTKVNSWYSKSSTLLLCRVFNEIYFSKAFTGFSSIKLHRTSKRCLLKKFAMRWCKSFGGFSDETDLNWKYHGDYLFLFEKM